MSDSPSSVLYFEATKIDDDGHSPTKIEDFGYYFNKGMYVYYVDNKGNFDIN